MINFKEIINLSNRTFLISAICAIEKQYYVHISIRYNNHVCVFDFNDISFPAQYVIKTMVYLFIRKKQILYVVRMVLLDFESADDIFVILYHIKNVS